MMRYSQLITFDMLHDDALLKISDLYVDEDFRPLEKQRIDTVSG